jgi:signal transduction histidine kinase
LILSLPPRRWIRAPWLGLSISHEIIKTQQGELTVESEVGKGSSFTVKLLRNGEIKEGAAA